MTKPCCLPIRRGLACGLLALAAALPLAAGAALNPQPGPSLPASAPAAPGQPPSVEQFVVPATLHHLEATVEHTLVHEDILRKIGPGFADGYKVSSATYVYTAPDRVDVHGRYGILSGTVSYTNTTQRVSLGFLHTTKDISHDITKRQTIFVLGLLPQNYLDTMRQQYLGTDTVNAIACDVFMLRYITDRVNDRRRFEIWVSAAQHYVVKKTVWDGGDHEHETVVYSNPVQALPGIWVPQQVDAYDTQGELGGTAVQKNIKAS